MTLNPEAPQVPTAVKELFKGLHGELTRETERRRRWFAWRPGAAMRSAIRGKALIEASKHCAKYPDGVTRNGLELAIADGFDKTQMSGLELWFLSLVIQFIAKWVMRRQLAS